MGRLASALSSFAQGFSSPRSDTQSGQRDGMVTVITGAGGWGSIESAYGGLEPSEIYRRSTWPHVSIKNVADKFSSLPLRVYQGDPRKPEEATELPENHPASLIIWNPSKIDTQFQLKQ